MASADKLIESFERNHWIIKAQAEGLAHADSLLQLPFRGNCFNWVLGHLAVNRDNLMPLFNESPALSAAEADPYRRGSGPLTEGETAVSMERLLEALDQLQRRIAAGLERILPDGLAAWYDEEHQRTVGDRIEFLLWHETYHVGQLEILRQLAGKDDVIIK